MGQQFLTFWNRSNEKEGSIYHTERFPSTRLVLNISKIALTFAFMFLAHNIFLMAQMEPTGYVIDIYSAMPETLVPTLIICFSIACFSVFSKIKGIRYAGILLLFAVLLTILLVPYSLGYYSMGRADDMAYIGEYVHISNTGHISGWDVYPASPIIGASIMILTAIHANVVSFIIPVVFSSLLVIGLYLFGRRFSKDKTYRSILLISSFILYMGPYSFFNTPHALFFAFLPIYLFVIFRYIESTDFSTSLIMVILSLLLPFTHPFIFFFVFVLLSALLILKSFIKKLADGDLNRLKTPLLLQLVSFMAWFIYSGSLVGSFQKSVDAYLLQVTEPVLLETTEKFATAGLDPLSLLSFLIIYYGRYIIPTIVIMALLTIYYYQMDATLKLKSTIRFLLGMYAIALIVEIILFVNPIISHQPDRMSNLLFLVYIQAPLFALSLIVFFKIDSSKFHHPTTRRLIVVGVVILTFGLSLFGAFDSPLIDRPNAALTYNEVTGMQWVHELRDGQNMSAPLSQIGRFHTLFDDGMTDNRTSIPDHFGYNKSTGTFMESILEFEGPLYLVTMTIDEVKYEEISAYKSVGRYTYGDYHQMMLDGSVNRIYSGKNIDVSYLYQ